METTTKHYLKDLTLEDLERESGYSRPIMARSIAGSEAAYQISNFSSWILNSGFNPKVQAESYLQQAQTKITMREDVITSLYEKQVEEFTILGSTYGYISTSVCAALNDMDLDIVSAIDLGTGDIFDFPIDEALADINSATDGLKVQVAAIAAVFSAENPGAEMAQNFMNQIQANVGEVTSQVSAMTAYLLNTVSTASSSLREVVNNLTGLVVPRIDGNTDCDIAAFTGVNPFLGWVSTTTGTALNNLSTASRVASAAIKGGLSMLTSAVISLGGKVLSTFTNPMDLEFDNQGEDPSCMTTSIEFIIPRSQFSGRTKFVHYIDGSDGWVVVPTIGCTMYMSTSDPDSDMTVLVKPHLYQLQYAKKLVETLSVGESSWSLMSETLTTLISGIGDNLYYPSLDGVSESEVFQALLYTKRLIPLGLSLAGFNAVSSAQYLYDIDENPGAELNLCWCKNTNMSTTGVTNLDWFTEYSSVSNDTLCVNTILGFVQMLNSFGLVQTTLSEGTLLTYPASSYNLYFAGGPIPGSYSIRTDAQNLQAVSNIMKVVAVIAVSILVSYVGKKRAVNRTKKLTNSQLALTQALSDPSATSKQINSAAKRVTRLSATCGSFPNVTNAVGFNKVMSIIR